MAGLVQVAIPKHLGDAVLCLAALRQLSDGLPERPMRLVCGNEWVLELLSGQGRWQRGGSGFVGAHDGLAVLLAPSLRVALQAWRAGIPRRIGHAVDGRGALLTDAVPGPPEPLPGSGLPALLPAEHQATSYLRIARHALGVLSGTNSPTNGEYSPRAAARALGEDWWRAAGRPTVLLHPWAAGLASKRWPVEHWLELARTLSSRGERLAISGGPGRDDAAVATALGRELQLPVAAGSSTLSPEAWVAGAQHCRDVVLCDTGLAHLAAAAGLEPIVLFGPTDPRRHGPLRGQVLTVNQTLDCAPCYRECSNPAGHLCMDSLGVADVVAALCSESLLHLEASPSGARI